MITSMHYKPMIVALGVFIGAFPEHRAIAAEDCSAASSECVAVGHWNVEIELGGGVRTNPLVGGENIPLVLIPHISYYGRRFFLDDLDVGFTIADTGSNTYLSITGRAEILHDVAKIRELWSSEAQAWWPKGPTDPDVRVLRVVPDSAEYWDTRGNSITVALKLAASRLSGNPPDLGENKKVRLL